MTDTKEFSLADVFALIRQSWLLFVLLPLLIAIGAFALGSFMKPVFRATVLLSSAAPESGGRLARLAAQFSPLSQLVGDLDSSGGYASREVQVATLRSRWLTEEFVRRHDLARVFFPEQWDEAAGDWRIQDGMRQAPSMDKVFRFVDEKVRSVEEDRVSGLVTLAMEWHDRTVVADWANGLVTMANDFMRTRAIEEARRGIGFLEQELDKTAVVERRQIIYRLIESKTSDIMLANARNDFAFVFVDRAVEPAADNRVRPRRMVMAALGFAVGGLIALLLAAVRWARLPASASAR